MNINWERILTEGGIAYVERGPNIKKGEIGITCPFCGAADSSQHMGLRDNGWWACWRNSTHRGKSPVRLLVKLLGVSYYRAREMAGLDNTYVDPDGFGVFADKLLGRVQNVPDRHSSDATPALVLPTDFWRIERQGRTRRFWDYLVEERGFGSQDVEALGQKYQLRAAITGDYKDRVILPYIVKNQIRQWTGRAIAEARLRYKDLPIETAGLPTKSLLYNVDSHRGRGNIVLAVVEGPFDALKLDFYGRAQGVRAVALSTNNITDDQLFELETIAPYFKNTVVMLDTEKELGIVDSMRVKSKMTSIPRLRIAAVPYGKKDCGELTQREVFQYTREITDGRRNAL